MQAAGAPTRQRLRLASHVRACHLGDQVILLDLRHSKYLSIGGQGLSTLACHVEGWPGGTESAQACTTSAALSALTQRLLSRGLLTNAPSRPHRDSTVDEATSSLDFERAVTDSTGGARRLGRFLQSAAVAALWLRCRSLHSIAGAVAARHERLEKSASDWRSPDAAFSTAAAYDRLRPFGFTAQDRCLHDSLALVGFLAAEGVLARWVIGVKTRPFGAHSWVQNGTTVLNDQHEHVRRFCPILVV
jgi:Transglutaminase-like superfamily